MASTLRVEAMTLCTFICDTRRMEYFLYSELFTLSYIRMMSLFTWFDICISSLF